METTKEKEEVEWGFWECPYCGEVNEDPNTVHGTMCHKGHRVVLSHGIDSDGWRRAIKRT